MSSFRAFTFEESIGGIEAWHLDSNGLRVLIAPQTIAPVATVNITYLVGSGDEQKGHTGATHYLEHLLFKGTRRFNRAAGTDLTRLLQRVGASINATTSMDRTNYYATLPVRYLELALEIEADRMRNAVLAEEDMEAERTVILNELDGLLNDPMYKLFRRVWSAVFTTHPYHHPVIGWREDVAQVSRRALKLFYDRYYWPANATLTMVGAVESDRVLPLVRQYFGSIPSGFDEAERPRMSEPLQESERRVSMKAPMNLSVQIMAYRACEALHKDAPALVMLGRILASGRNSRLWGRLTDTGLAAQVNAGFMPLRDPGIFSVMAVLVPGRSHEEIEAAIEESIRAIQMSGPTEVEMARAKAQLIAHEAFARDGSYGVASGLNESIAMGAWQLFTTGRQRLEEVTCEDVQRVAREFLQPQYRTVGWLSPADS
ncbi:MAG: pitrilysin family protein [Bacteroidota bacterium]|nr:pitrilysin family protein [Bacteroidota bacterium]MDE2834912.1 pitrilysin family protein [Bacteroidota bacterium]